MSFQSQSPEWALNREAEPNPRAEIDERKDGDVLDNRLRERLEGRRDSRRSDIGENDNATEYLPRNDRQQSHREHDRDSRYCGRLALALACQSKQSIVWIQNPSHVLERRPTYVWPQLEVPFIPGVLSTARYPGSP